MSIDGVEAYEKLEAIFAQHYYLKRIDSVLQWDTAVMLPRGAMDARAKQQMALQTCLRSVLADPQVFRLLDRVDRAVGALSEWQRANVRQMRVAYARESALPEALSGALAHACVLCESAWREARRKNDFHCFAKPFAMVLTLVQEKAEHLAQAWHCEPYEALMREYDADRTLVQSDHLFEQLQVALPPLMQRARSRFEKGAEVLNAPTLSLARQQALCRIVLRDLGFDFAVGRLDQSEHPFTEGGFQDIRITTSYSRRNACSGLLGAIHEYGHAAYDAGLPERWHSQPVGRDLGMSMHEGMALFYEMALARTPAFINYLQTLFASQGWSFDKALYSGNLLRVKPGCIRIDADELSYPAHITLRYRMEQQLLQGSLAIADIPDCWNAHMHDLLGIQPKTLAQGCLQDIHWSLGLFGYFPSYAFGAMYAANIYVTLQEQGVALQSEAFDTTQFHILSTWLRHHIASKGAFLPERALQDALGLTDIPRYLNYLEARYC